MGMAERWYTMAFVVFDFDGTLSRDDLTQLLGREYDVGGEVMGPNEQVLVGESDVGETVRQRVALLEGMPERRLDRAFGRARLRKGAPELIADLRNSGVTVGIIAASFERGIEAVLDGADVTVDHIVANDIVLENGAVSGNVEGPLLERSKGEALQELAIRETVPSDEIIAVGNGAFDLSMLQVAGTAIGFRPDPDIEPHCDHVVTSMPKLRLYFEQHGLIDHTAP